MMWELSGAGEKGRDRPFNVLNRVNYLRYIGTLTSPFVGQAILARPARPMQLSVRVKF
jgi:hypothetical protein